MQAMRIEEHTEEPSRRRGTTAPEGAATLAATRGSSVGLPGGFEHRRAIASARERLFGIPSQLSIGRYRVEDRIGAGGMGEVYLGVDEALDRQVAIKRVLARAGDERAQERLRREARALAKLSHPNVVQVYESGEHEGRTFLAMEYVAGQTLGEWLAAEPRSWRAILARFVAAGRGLAAAHRAGVVHRDFKPDNVLIGDDGSVRVADFGLALGREQREPVDPGAAGPLEPRLSNAGSIVGTIRYMSLEQLRGEEVDERSDQFSFCVGLYEALWDEQPFALSSVSRRLLALEEERPRAPRRGSIPLGLWRALRRGLAPEPGARWPDMDALLDALVAVPRRRRWIARGIGAGLTLALAATATVLALPEPDRCAAVEAELVGTWDEARRAELAEVFGAAELGHAADSQARVEAALDRWAGAWVGAREQACRGELEARVDPLQARLTAACLGRQRAQVESLVDALASGEGARALAGAVEAAETLPSPDRCADIDELLAVDPPPPALASAVTELQRDVDRVHELRLLGRFDQALALAEDARSRAGELGYGPVEAEAAAELAKAELRGGSPERGAELLLEAIDLAEAHRHDRLAASLWTTAASQAANEHGGFEAGERRLRRATAGWQRVHPELHDRSRLALVRARLAASAGRRQDAQAELEAALAELGERDTVERPAIHAALAELFEAADPEAALREREAAVAAARRFWGAKHPDVAVHLYELGRLRWRRGETERASALLEEAATLWTEAFDRPHPELALARTTLAQLALAEGRREAAQRQVELLAEAQRELPPRDPSRGRVELLRAKLAGLDNQRGRAVEHGERALSLLEPKLGPDEPAVIQLRTELASHLTALGRYEAAATRYAELLDDAELDPAAALPIHLGLAEVELRRGALGQARVALAAVDALPLSSLGSYALPHALLGALVSLRSGGLEAGQREALAEALTASPYTEAQLAAWYGELELTARERRALGL